MARVTAGLARSAHGRFADAAALRRGLGDQRREERLSSRHSSRAPSVAGLVADLSRTRAGVVVPEQDLQEASSLLTVVGVTIGEGELERLERQVRTAPRGGVVLVVGADRQAREGLPQHGPRPPGGALEVGNAPETTQP